MRSTPGLLSDTDTDTIADAAVHPGSDVSGRHADAEAHEDAEAHGSTDTDASTHVRTVAERDDRGGDVVALTDTVADRVALADARTCAGAQPRARDARTDRFGCDDRRIGVDLAPLPQLARIPRALRALRVRRPSQPVRNGCFA